MSEELDKMLQDLVNGNIKGNLSELITNNQVESSKEGDDFIKHSLDLSKFSTRNNKPND